MEQPSESTKGLKCSTWAQSENDRMVSVHFQGKPFIITVTQVYASTSNAGWTILWRPIRPSRTKTKKRYPFDHRGLECKSRKSRITEVTGTFDVGVQKKAEQRRTEFYQENALVIANTHFHQHNRQLHTWTSPDGNIKIRLIIFCAVEGGEALYNQQRQDWELTVAQIMNSLLPNSDLNWGT